MKIYLDKEKIKEAAIKSGKSKSLKKLCNEAGVNYNHLYASIEHERPTPTLAWLISDYLDCPMQDLYTIDWSRNSRGE